METKDLRYPIGRFSYPEKWTSADIDAWAGWIERLPAALQSVVEGWTHEQFDTPYRPDGWTVRQLIHHIADSHINAYTRFRLTLTEDTPIIRPYEEKEWAKLDDAMTGPVSMSIGLLTHLHDRWSRLIKSLNLADFDRAYFHPEDKINYSLGAALAMYAWHSEHHLQHVKALAEREGW